MTTTPMPHAMGFRWDLLWARGSRVASGSLALAALSLLLPWAGGSVTRTYYELGGSGNTVTSFAPSLNAFETGAAWLVLPFLVAAVGMTIYRRGDEQQEPVVAPLLPLLCAGVAWLVAVIVSAQSLAATSDMVTGAYGSYYPDAASGAMLCAVLLLPFLWRLARTARETPWART